MKFELKPFASGLIKKQAIEEVMSCNAYTQQFGLALTEAQAIDLVKTRSNALIANGRIELGGGVIDKIIKEFCDSPYIFTQNYTQTLNDLIKMFYYYKNETMDLISDDDLIEFMKSYFDGACQGSLNLLSGRELYRLAKNLRSGLSSDYTEDDIFVNEEDSDE